MRISQFNSTKLLIAVIGLLIGAFVMLSMALPEGQLNDSTNSEAYRSRPSYVAKGCGHSTHYGKAVATLTTNSPSGAGSVYVGFGKKGSTSSVTWNCGGSSSNDSKTLRWDATFNPGYYFVGWYTDKEGSTLKDKNNPYTESCTAVSTDSNNPTTFTYYGLFASVEFGEATPSSASIRVTDLSKTYSGEFSIATLHADDKNDYNAPSFTIASGGSYNTDNWSWANNSLTIPYVYTPTKYTNATDVMLVTSSGKTSPNSKSIDVVITRPDIEIVGGNAGEQMLPSSPTTDFVAKATFDVKYTNGAQEFSAAFNNIQGNGVWTVGSIVYSLGTGGAGTITVNYTFNASGNIGSHSADLTLTANTAGGATCVVHPTALVEAVKDYDVEIFDAKGISVFTGSWTDGLAEVNAQDGATVQLARNVDLGTLGTSCSFTKTVTLDLNGKTLSATSVDGKYLINLDTDGKILTIKDSKAGGTISAIGSANTTLYAVRINQGALVMEGGAIYAENKLAYMSSQTGMSVRALQLGANAAFTMNGGSVTGVAGNNTYAVRQEGAVNAKGKTIINGGTINADCKREYAYGISTVGKLEMHGGTVNAKTYTSTGSSNVYGIYLAGSANLDPAKEYGAELTMTGGEVNVTAQKATAVAVYVYGAVTVFKDADGNYTHANCRAYPAVAYISGGTFNAFTTTYGAYGIRVMNSVKTEDEAISTTVVKPTVITGGAFHAEATTNGAYAIMADAQSSWGFGTISQGIVEVSNVVATAKTGTSSAYGAYVNAQGKIFDEDNTNMNYNTTYKIAGEWVAAGKMTINSGTFSGTATTNTAAGVGVATRGAVRVGKTSDDIKYAYGELIINDGVFTGKTLKNNVAYGLSSGGNTIVRGGTFIADAATTHAAGVVTLSGRTILSGATLKATARDVNGGAYGLYALCSVADITGITHPSEIVANNLNVTAESLGGNARGAYVGTTQRTLSDDTYNKLSDSNKKAYKNMYIRGEWATAGKVTVNGGTYTVTSATMNAYGARVDGAAITASGETMATGELTIKNAMFTVHTGSTNGAYGVWTGGETTIDDATFNVQSKTTNAYGLYVYDKKTTVANSVFNVMATASAYGAHINAYIHEKCGYLYQGELETNEGTVFNVNATAGNTAQGVTLVAAKRNIAQGSFAGDYVAASSAVINGGTYTAQASGTIAYGVFVPATITQGAKSATASCVVNGGKFKATATDNFAGVNANGKPGCFVLYGGYFVQKTNTEKYLAPEANVVELKTTLPEYTEGYRYKVTSDMTGEVVCKIGNDRYATLEEALQYVNLHSDNYTIVMVADYTLPAGEYVLPENATLLIPYKDSQVDILGPNPVWVNKYSEPTPTTPYAYRKLTFASGVNLTVKGKIEASSTLYINQSKWTGIVGGPYGWLQLNEGSRVDLDQGAYLYAWGYVTGKGEITAKNGSYVYEDFQMGDWRGGTVEGNVQNNKRGVNSKSVFLITDYYIQNIECPTTFMAGANEIAYSGCFMEALGQKINGKSEAVKLVGTEEAMFLMNPATAGTDTWVRKEYDPTSDRLIWTLNSGASIGSFQLKINASFVNIDLVSSDYVLPIPSNFTLIANKGDIYLTNDVCFIPGSEVLIRKESSMIVAANQNVFFYDTDDWKSYGGYFHKVGYSPSWGTNPRTSTTKLDDAKVQIEGLFDIRGQLWTTAGGANIFSTKDNAGKVRFQNNAPAALNESDGKNTLNQLIGAGPDYDPKAITSAKLKNADGLYTSTDNCKAGDIYTYMQDPEDGEYRWIAVSENGCFTEMKSEDTKWYIRPSDMVAVEENENGDHAYHNEDKTRFFINTNAAKTSVECVWWEAEPKGIIEGVTYYMANNKNFDNFGSYFYWDETLDYWVAKTVTITFKNWDGSILMNGTFGNSYNFNVVPQYYGANPTKENTAIYNYSWVGWDTMVNNMGEAQIGRNDPLPIATEDVTYYAHFNADKWQYTVTFKNDDGSVIESKLVNAGDIPTLSNGVEPAKASTISTEYIFKGWDKILVAVTGPAEYIAQYDTKPRAYRITFYDYDATTILQQSDVAYGTTPTYDKYEPVRERTSAYSYDFDGWQSKSGDVIVKGTKLPIVTGQTCYVAHFAQTARRYKVTLDVAVNGATCDVPFVERAYETTLGELPEAVKEGYSFVGWFTEPSGGAQVTAETLITEDVTLYARFTVDEEGALLDIVDWTDKTLTINATGFVPLWPYTINEATFALSDLNQDRTATVSYTGNHDDLIRISVTSSKSKVISSRKYRVPHIITSNVTLSGTKEESIVFVKEGATLTIAENTTLGAVYVDPGAELVVNSGVVLTADSLMLRTTPWAAASLDNNGTIYAKVYYTRIVSDRAYHQFALPLSTTISGAFLSNSAKFPYEQTWQLKQYSESSRAENGAGDNATNWVPLNSSDPIKATIGYELYSGSAYYREIYFPVNITESVGNTVSVSHTDGAAGPAHAGWNALCSPLLGKYKQNFKEVSEAIKVSELTEDGNYWQHIPEVINPAVPFYYQAPQAGTLDFSGSELKQNAPRRAWHTQTTTQWLRLTLSDAAGKMLDETNVFTHPEKFSVDYETGYDVTKQSTQGGKALLYSELACGALAFAAVPDSVAESRIPLTVYTAEAKAYTFHLEDNAYLNRLGNVFLHDTETGAVIDLLTNDYVVTLSEGTTRGRFYITCVFRAQNITTDTETTVQDKQNASVQKVLYNGKVYILRNGTVYDLTGRQCEMK